MEKFDVTGMTCAACSAHVERAVRGVEGVKEVTVSLLTNSMTVDFSLPATAEKICSAVSSAASDVYKRQGLWRIAAESGRQKRKQKNIA